MCFNSCNFSVPCFLFLQLIKPSDIKIICYGLTSRQIFSSGGLINKTFRIVLSSSLTLATKITQENNNSMDS